MVGKSETRNGENTKMAEHITEWALIHRLNRKLKLKNIAVRKSRGAQSSPARLGDYYLLDLEHNAIAAHNLTLADLEGLVRVLANIPNKEKNT
jgi:hypothetical protein